MSIGVIVMTATTIVIIGLFVIAVGVVGVASWLAYSDTTTDDDADYTHGIQDFDRYDDYSD